MEVICSQCFSEPTLRKCFTKEAHTPNICLKKLSLKVKIRQKEIEEKEDRIKTIRNFSDPFSGENGYSHIRSLFYS
jgi:hypothetical protein